jgi:tetratricopeptide (TPR) repeat protein
MNIFGMVTTRHSQAYTGHCLRSFFQTTSLVPTDRFFVIDDDGTCEGSTLATEARLTLNVRPGAHFASLDPELRGPRTRHHLALAYRAQGRLDDAEEQWRLALVERPDLVLAWLELAEMQLARGRWAELEHALEQVQAEPRLAGEAQVLRARACLARQEFGPCRQLLEEVIAHEPRAVTPRQFLSYCLLQEHRDLAAAERVLRELVQLEPRDVEAWRNLALLLRGQGRLNEAVAVCQAGESHCAGDLRWLLVHGLVRFDAGDLAGAEPLLLRFLENQPLANGHDEASRGSLNTARRHLALIYHQGRRYGEAEAQWRAALADQPELLSAWLGLAEVCLEEQRWEELEEIAGRLEGTTAGRLKAAVVRARRCLGQRDYAGALALLEPAIAAQPEAIGPRVVRSRVLVQEGRDPRAAEAALRAVLELDANHREARHNLAVLLAEGRNGRSGVGASL